MPEPDPPPLLTPRSDLARFLVSLADHGHAVVDSTPPEPDDAEALLVLRQVAERATEDIGESPPDLDPAAAVWAARRDQFPSELHFGRSLFKAGCGR